MTDPTVPDPTACQYCGRVLPTSHAAAIHERHYCDKRPAVQS